MLTIKLRPITVRSMENNKETWKPVPGYEGKYEVSDHGRVKSVARKVHRGRTLTSIGKVPERIRKPATNKDGHLYLTLHKDGTRKHFFVHYLVLLAFVGPRPHESAQVRHLDGNHENNHISNLKYGTNQENVDDMIKHGTHRNLAKTHCKHGHEFNVENTYWRPDGGRDCKPCARSRKTLEEKAAYMREYRARKANPPALPE